MRLHQRHARARAADDVGCSKTRRRLRGSGQAIDLSWTRDPFDRLLVAHARLRGWRFATADAALLKRLERRESGSRC